MTAKEIYRCLDCNHQFQGPATKYDGRTCEKCQGPIMPIKSMTCGTRANRPPLGLMPRHIWDERRIEEIGLAIQRYLDARAAMPPEWIEEYNELTSKLQRGGSKVNGTS